MVSQILRPALSLIPVNSRPSGLVGNLAHLLDYKQCASRGFDSWSIFILASVEEKRESVKLNH